MRTEVSNRSGRRAGPRARAVVATGLLLASASAHASFLSGDALDTAADVLAWIVIVLVPLVGIALFWMVHVLPEKIAHKRHHPQKDAIQTLCLLSLVFGGLLWPFAWLWAYTKPVMYRMAHGTERGEAYFIEMSELAADGELDEHELHSLRDEIVAIASRGALSPALRVARARVEAARPKAASSPPAPSPPSATGGESATAGGA
jgi:CBS domain containing-hemolysin-like protein